jgi:hypothetical protein
MGYLIKTNLTVRTTHISAGRNSGENQKCQQCLIFFSFDLWGSVVYRDYTRTCILYKYNHSTVI